MAFEPNRGQTADEVDYLARGEGYTLFLTGGDAVFDLTRPAGLGRAAAANSVPGGGGPAGQGPAGAVVRMDLVGGATQPSATGFGELGGTSSYLRGDDPAGWHARVPHYAGVRYHDVYPGVDAVYRRDADGRLEYDFHVAAGADPDTITLGFDGVEGLRLDEDGALLLDTAVGTLRQQPPVAYQPTDAGRQRVEARFTRRGEDQLGFELGVYDPEAPLVIDPVVVYSSYLGGRRNDEARDVAADDAGNAYVTGETQSGEFPTTSGAYQDACHAPEDGPCTFDAFVTKLDTTPDGDGPAVAHSTYLGGTGDDRATSIAVDGAGAAYVTGATTSSDFPTAGGFDGTCGVNSEEGCGPGGDAFIAKLQPDGSGLAYSAYLGGSGNDHGHGVAVEGATAYVTGETTSGDFPTTSGAYDRDCGADGDGACDEHRHGTRSDAFVVRLSAEGSQLDYATYVGGSNRDHGHGVAVNEGAAYVTGRTDRDFPTTEGASQSECTSCGFVFKLAADGSDLEYSTYLGGDSLDSGRGIAVDGAGSAYVTGETISHDFPTTARAFETGCSDGTNTAKCAFVTKLDHVGAGIAYSARFGTSNPTAEGVTIGEDIAIGDDNRAYITGGTGAGGSRGFPVTPDGYDTSCGGCPESGDAKGSDGFVAVLPPDGSAPEYSTFLGGSDPTETARGIAVDSAGDIYVAGFVQSGDHPTMDATQTRHAGTRDGFVVKLTRQPQRPIIYSIDPRTGPTAGGTEVSITGRGLGGVTEVRFGDQPVAAEDFTVESDTEITATAPPVGPPATKPDTVMVTVTDERGTSPPTSRARFSTYQGHWSPVGEFSDRSYHTATRLGDGRVLLAGGTGDGHVEIYDPGSETGTVTEARSMTTSRNRHSATLLEDGRVLVAGGLAADTHDAPTLARAEIYDPQAETWTATSEPMHTARHSHTATLLPDGRVLVAGGLQSRDDGLDSRDSQELDSAEVYDPAEDEWSPAPSLSTGRGKHTATALDDGRVLVVGGILLTDPGPDGDDPILTRIPPVEIYDPGLGGWTDPPGPARTRHFQHTATKLVDGRVLVAGGFTSIVRSELVPDLRTNLAEVFDPNADPVWRATAGMTTSRATHAAARLADGRVLVAGDPDRYEVTDVETYDPAGDGAWHNSAPMLVGGDNSRTRNGLQAGAGRGERAAPHTATLLSASAEDFIADPAACGNQCGDVLVVGDGTAETPAERYTPAPSVSGIQPAAGEEGTEVTIAGAGFDEETEVLFGQTPAQEVRVDSFGQLTAVAPAGADGSDAQVTVRNPQGLDAAPQRFCYGGSCGATGDTDNDTGEGTGDDDSGDVDNGDVDTTPEEETEPAEVPSDDPGRAPGRVDDLTAEAQSGTEIELFFSAVGTDGDGQPPPAGDYIVKQSTEPIDSDAAFDDAFSLCGEVCSFGPAAVGDPLSLTVTDLEPETTYHYAVKARDPAGNLGERSNPASATTSTAAAGGGPASACDEQAVPASGFDDIAGSVHEGAIDCLAWYAITLGLGDVDGDGVVEYGPRQPITRAQMATFLSRVAAEAGLSLPTDAPDAFGDDDGSIHAPRIDALAALGITHGKGDLDGDGRPDFAPGEPVARDQMASFLTRLHQRVTGTLPAPSGDRFGDDDGSVHEPAINALAALGVTQGKGDLDGDGVAEYAPREPVSRAQMASFLARELEQLVEAGAVHPGGAEVLLDDTEATVSEALTGRVRSHRQVTSLVADGCGIEEESVALNEQRAFTLPVPSGQSAGACELTLTATVQPVDPAAEGRQRVTYHFDVTVGE